MSSNQGADGFFTALVRAFLKGYTSWIFVFFAICFGISAILLTPREEEPQIVVPMADIFVQYPGAEASEIENLVANPLEKLLYQIDGVEYVYSISNRDVCQVTVRFYVKEDREDSLLKLYNKVESNIDQVIPGIQSWIIKPVEIDDVPIIGFHFYSKTIPPQEIRRIAREIESQISTIGDVSRTNLYGSGDREVQILLDPQKLRHFNLTALEVHQAIEANDASLTAGVLRMNNQSLVLRSGPFLEKIEDLNQLIIRSESDGLGKVRLSEVAKIQNLGSSIDNYTQISIREGEEFQVYDSVALMLSKKKGSNAVNMAQRAVDFVQKTKESWLPQDLQVKVTRNYGATADEKVDELLNSLLIAILGVVTLIALSMGWREALVVALAVPISFCLSLFVNLIAGYTINRVTLFALILSLGLVVDDPITNVDNIQRHIEKDPKNPMEATVRAIREVLQPVLMSTLAIIVSFLPMFFITGMMGPYMEPMAIHVPLTVTFSTLCALTFVPYAAFQLIRRKIRPGTEQNSAQQSKAGWNDRIYRKLMNPLLESNRNRILLVFVVVLLMASSGALVLTQMVPLKMLPFDNKDEFQVVVNLPEGSTLERTQSVLSEMSALLYKVEEVVHVESYAGIAAPMDFNGMVRHYYLRKGDSMGDLRVKLKHKSQRDFQSHNIVLRIRNDLSDLASSFNATIEIVEVPPGPPVLATIVAEIYADPGTSLETLREGTELVLERFHQEPNLVDIDSTLIEDHEELHFEIDRVKAAQFGITPKQVHATLRLAVQGMDSASLHDSHEKTRIPLTVRFSEAVGSQIQNLEAIRVRSIHGNLVPLKEIGAFQRRKATAPRYHKNLKRLSFVTSEIAGKAPAPAILNLQKHFRENPLPEGLVLDFSGEGEWKITIDVFRDLGLAFGAALIGIYFLIVLETGSLLLPLLIMLAIPLTAIGIMPGFYLLNLVVSTQIGGFETPVFFTATGMIGMIALGGIVVRNSMVLIQFIQYEVDSGVSMKEAILRSGTVRLRPILLTAGTTMIGAWPITFDPIFSGLAWSLIFGLLASTAFTLIVVPTAYYWVYKD